MATTQKDLTTNWVLVSATSCLIEAVGTKHVEIHNAAALPTGEQPCHNLRDREIRPFPTPASGNWYARVSTGTGTLILTEVS